jgi:voltage-gated potassium channel
MISLVIILWLLFSAGFYFADRGGSGTAIEHYGDALWWGLVAMTTMGTASIPVTGAGLIVGGIWAVLGVILFWGTIIASVTSYFLHPRQRPSQQIISTVQYNLEQLDDLSLEELELLKETTDGLIDRHIGRLKREQSSGNDSKIGKE